jgi:hypothetical protein
MSDTPRTDHAAWDALVTADFARELERDLAQRTAERDEARRQACRDELHVRMGIYTAKEFAVKRGWDCFDAPHTNATDVSVRNGGAA